MNIERRPHPIVAARDMYRGVRMLLSPNYLSRKVLRHVKPNGVDEQLIPQLTQALPLRSIMTASEILGEKKLSTRENMGIIYFSSLILQADNLMDRDRSLWNLPKEQLAQFLLSHDATNEQANKVITMTDAFGKEKKVTLQNLLDLTLNSFADKKDIIINFLNTMLDLHSVFPLKPQGEHGYDQVLSYRRNTDGAWVKTVLNLIGSNDEGYVKDITAAALAVQHYDDIIDWVDDWNRGAMNLYTEYAAQYHPEEFSVLKEYASTHVGERLKSKVFPTLPILDRKWLTTNTPKTFEEYRARSLELVDSIQNKRVRFMRVLSRLSGVVGKLIL